MLALLSSSRASLVNWPLGVFLSEERSGEGLWLPIQVMYVVTVYHLMTRHPSLHRRASCTSRPLGVSLVSETDILPAGQRKACRIGLKTGRRDYHPCYSRSRVVSPALLLKISADTCCLRAWCSGGSIPTVILSVPRHFILISPYASVVYG